MYLETIPYRLPNLLIDFGFQPTSESDSSLRSATIMMITTGSFCRNYNYTSGNYISPAFRQLYFAGVSGTTTCKHFGEIESAIIWGIIN